MYISPYTQSMCNLVTASMLNVSAVHWWGQTYLPWYFRVAQGFYWSSDQKCEGVRIPMPVPSEWGVVTPSEHVSQLLIDFFHKVETCRHGQCLNYQPSLQNLELKIEIPACHVISIWRDFSVATGRRSRLVRLPAVKASTEALCSAMLRYAPLNGRCRFCFTAPMKSCSSVGRGIH